jgi:hypothetical protein
MSDVLFVILQFLVTMFRAAHYYTRVVILMLFPVDTNTYSRAYFLADEREYDPSITVVPENAVYIEEWANKDGDKLCYVHYAGEEIGKNLNPFLLPRVKSPWLWIGDRDTDIDLTRAFNKFLAPGNCIRLALVVKLIHVRETSDLAYIDANTYELEKFPGNGIYVKIND